MTQTSFPFENIDTTETQFSQWARNIGEGFVADDNNDRLEVEAGTGLSVDVAPGRALVRGHYYTSTAVESLALAVADTDNPRLDTVVLRLDPTENSIVLAVVTGTPSDPAVGPTLTQTDAGVYELPVVDVLVPANSGVPTTITDRRDFVTIDSLASVGDVNFTALASNEFLRYDGTEWVNTAADATTSTAGVVLGTTSDGTNTALGDGALESNTTGSSNTASGYYALQSNTTGNYNTASGYYALQSNTTGSSNTASGYYALQSNTTGEQNTAFGYFALESNTTGKQNTATGYLALRSNTEGNDNTASGYRALRLNTTGEQNTASGYFAGDRTTTGSNNTTLGFTADPSSATASNQVTLGNSSITSLRCNQTSISSLSDVRDKTNIVDTQHGLDTLNKIRPVDFTWARRDGSFGSAPDIGFIAQELASVEDETGDAQRLRLTLRDNPEKLEATPGRLIPILVKAVQELSAKNDELEARIEALEAK